MKLKNLFTYNKQKEEKASIEMVKNSELFDASWYLEKNPDIKASRIDAAKHYYKIGWKEGRNPSERFDTKKYLEKYPECQVCPIVFAHNRNAFVDLAVCAIMKNEGPYVKEWIDYHRLVGVKRFYIYDNESTDNMKEVLDPYIAQGIVVYKYQKGVSQQIPAYNECLNKYRNDVKWCAFIDADEYIVPVEKNSVSEFLRDYEQYPAVEMDFVFYDSNGYLSKPKGGVLENYMRRQYELQSFRNHRGKSIVQLSKCEKMHVHVGFYFNKESAVTENKIETYSRDYHDYVSVNKIRLNHYHVKSREEYIARVSKGNAYNVNATRKFISSDLCFDDYLYDFPVLRFLIKLYPEKTFVYLYKYLLCYVKNIFIKFMHMMDKDSVANYINENWYFNQYPDAQKSGISAMEHYLTIGWKKGYNPSDKFDTNFYLKQYPSVRENKVNPFVHYISFGKREGKLPNPNYIKDDIYISILDSGLFDKKWYTKKYLKGKKVDVIEHYLNEGWKLGYNPSKKFDTNFYLMRYPDIANVGINPLIHYVKHGIIEGRLPKAPQRPWWKQTFIYKRIENKSEKYANIIKSGLFDERWYLSNYPDVKISCINPLQHYLTIGWKQGYNPSKKFDTNFYLNTYPDIKQAGGNPLLHYINAGKKEGREISEVFEYKKSFLQVLWQKFFVKKLHNPKISIIVASYNYEQYIRETLDSLINQTYDNFEVIVVDDGSKDNSIAIIKEYTSKYDKVFLYSHENDQNRGLVETIKLGIAKSSGDYIAFCESDDYWTPNHLEEKVKLINKYFNPEIIANDVELFDQPTEEYITYLDNGIRKFQGEIIKINVMQQKYNPLATFSSIMFRKNILEKCNFTSVIPAWIDWWLHRQILIKYPLYFVNKRLTMWRIHDSYNTTERNNKYAEKYNEFMVYNNSLLAKENSYVNEYLKNNIDYKTVAESDLFDEKFYKEKYPEVKQLKIPAIYHFNMIGWKKGNSPSNRFDVKAYRDIYKDVKEADINPLLHYIRIGKKEGRLIVSCDYKPSTYISSKRKPDHYKGKILLVSHMLNHTGAPILLKQVAELLISKRYLVTIMSPIDGDLRDEILASGCDVIIDTLAYADECYCDKYKKNGFEFCICNTYISAYIYSYLSKFIPSILWIHDNLNEKTANLIMPVLSTSKDIYAASKLTKSYMTPYNKDIKILTYPANDVVGQINKRKNNIQHKMRIAVCAALQPRKGQDIFIEAIKMLPENIRRNAEFLILGEEAQKGYRKDLDNLCGNIPEIIFVDIIKDAKKYHEFIDGLDVLCCPSREDPCPLVVLDAFMHGVPVIVSDHVGQKDIIRNKKDGYIFKNEDINELSQILNHLIVSKEYLLLRNKSRAIFDRNFSDKTFLNELFKIMEKKCKK